MYTRDFQSQDGALHIPESYSGTAFEEAVAESPAEEACRAEPRDENAGIFASIKRFLPISGLNIPGFGSGEFKIGTEEILIAALALFLFFSHDGDRECALMLLFLLFIN